MQTTVNISSATNTLVTTNPTVSTTKPTTQEPVSLATSLSSETLGCQFQFGMSFNGNKDYPPADYLTIWIGSPSSTHGTNFNPWYH